MIVARVVCGRLLICGGRMMGACIGGHVNHSTENQISGCLDARDSQEVTTDNCIFATILKIFPRADCPVVSQVHPREERYLSSTS